MLSHFRSTNLATGISTRRSLIEALEPRALLSVSAVEDGTVTVIGNDDPNDIRAFVDDQDKLNIVVDGITTKFENANVKRLDVFGKGGDDSIDIDASVRQPTRLDGGADNDKISAGSGATSASGGSGDDDISGSPRNDRIHGGWGNDILRGRSGNDTIVGDPEEILAPARVEADNAVTEPSLRLDWTLAPEPPPTFNDVIHGGRGDDTLRGVWGNDLIHGESGNDVLHGGFGHDGLLGGPGNDQLHGGFGHDALLGGADNDRLSGDEQADALVGGDGDDGLDGGGGDDWLFGDGTNDVPDDYAGQGLEWYARNYRNAGRGSDKISGDDGNDHAFGGNLSDGIDGGDGRDLILGGAGGDNLSGGNQLDIILGDDVNARRIARPSALADSATDAGRLALVDEVLSASDLAVEVASVRGDVINGGSGDDILLGMRGNDTMNGGGGSDWMHGGSGNDQMDGDSPTPPAVSVGPARAVAVDARPAFAAMADVGIVKIDVKDVPIPVPNANDVMFGGAGNDSIDGMIGNDTVHGGDGRDRLSGGEGHDLLSGDDGNDNLHGGGGNDRMVGGEGHDQLIGGNGNDTMSGGNGSDVLRGGAGNDDLAGGAGSDVLLGEAGRDALVGGSGTDFLSGGADADKIDAKDGQLDFICSDNLDTVEKDEGLDIEVC